MNPSNTEKRDVRSVYAEGGAEALRNAQTVPWTPPHTSFTTTSSPYRAGRNILPEDEGPFSHAEKGDCNGPPKIQPFEFRHCRDVVPVLETFDFVEGILTDGGVSVVYAPSGAGKSFWALDLCAHVANGEIYRDELAVEQGAVLYLTLEGGKLFANRIAALKKDGRIDDDTALFSSTVPFNLLSLPDPFRLIETIRQIEKQYEVRFRMVVIDTLARAITGADESSNEVMGRVLASAEAVCAATGSHVMLVHHTGKIEAKGARGGSALKCGLDTEIELGAGVEGMVIATVTKAKEMEKPLPMVFSLRKIELGVNTRGRPVTSCVVDHHPEIVAEKPTGEASRFQKMKPAPTPSQVLDLLPLSGSIPRKLFEAEGMTKLNATVRDFKAVLERLIVDEKVRVTKEKAMSGQPQSCLVRA